MKRFVMTTAFVLSGGGSLGAAQVGMLRALTAYGIHADLVVGASVGSLNAAFYAARPDTQGVDELARLWLQVGEHDVYPLEPSQMLPRLLASFPGRPVRAVLRALGGLNYIFPVNPLLVGRAAAGRADHVFSNRRFEDFLHRVLPLERIEDATVPLKILATDACDGRGILLTYGPAVPALMASTAVPGFYPPVEIEGRHLIDGAVANGTTLDRAIALGADEVYVLARGFPCHLCAPPSTVLAMAIHAYNLLEEQRMAASITQARAHVRLHVLPPVRPVELLPIDFRQTAQLIEAATDSTQQWLDHGPHDVPNLTSEVSRVFPTGRSAPS
ncbi:patatin-like phospholipase family protein [Streptomyces sp. NPDC127063]|uniref:patatin-like phospholipase family protein n=1 Tax=Streptomyces sp. NPDC127063 TaxID=3347123 RepID=UPI00365ABC81